MNNDDDNKEKNISPFYHHTDNFSSAYFGKIPEHVNPSASESGENALMASVISLLAGPQKNEHRPELLALLRSNKADGLLLKMLGRKDYLKYRKELLAACWESGLDFSKHLSFFAGMTLNADYESCIEITTIITECMQGPFEKETTEAAISEMKRAGANDSVKMQLLETAITFLNIRSVT
ncbi:MAG TPA: hypothetical protein VFU15_08710 [Bacteroidia bacterium]|nr:hypothetical protein [Bacteroidia bacterium]